MALSDDQIWTEFTGWLQSEPPLPSVSMTMERYAKRLAERGANQPAVMETMGRIQSMMRRRPDAWPLLFDTIFTAPESIYRSEPTVLLAGAIAGRRPGRALDVGMGQGRNAVFLARQGWAVTGLELSTEGIAAARAAAAHHGVSLDIVQTDVPAFDFGENRWHLIVITYGPALAGEAESAERLIRALAPGGLLVIETFASDRTNPVRKPVDLDPADVLRLFSRLRIRRFEDVDDTSEWVPRVTRLVRLVAEKRA
jgi:SAM-dependent methyltransferase